MIAEFTTRKVGESSVYTDEVMELDPADALDDVVTAFAISHGGCDGAEFIHETVKSDAFKIPLDCKPKDLGFKYSVSCVTPKRMPSEPGMRYMLTRFNSLKKTACVHYRTSHGCRVEHFGIYESGYVSPVRTDTFLYKAGEFVPVPKFTGCFSNTKRNFDNTLQRLTTDASEDMQPRLAMGIAFVQDLCWAVLLGEPSRRVRVSCDPLSIREFFESRDSGPNGRRRALRHWVKQHLRKRKTAKDCENAKVWVRRHLRGDMRFKWNGIECEVVVSPSDLRSMAK